jgi:hypothetical protein
MQVDMSSFSHELCGESAIFDVKYYNNWSRQLIGNRRRFMVVGAVCAGVAVLFSETNAAPLQHGSVIGIDFGNKVMPNPPRWNTLAEPGDDIVVGRLVSLQGAVVAGVGFSTEVPCVNGKGNSVGQKDTSDSSGAFSAIPVNAQEDWWYENENDAEFVFMFTGLDDSLTYTLTIGAYRDSNDLLHICNGDTGWTVNGKVGYTDVNLESTSYLTFPGLKTDGSGNLVISSVEKNENQVSAVSALLLIAVQKSENSVVGELPDSSSQESAKSGKADVSVSSAEPLTAVQESSIGWVLGFNALIILFFRRRRD